MKGESQKIYLNGKTKQIWSQLKPVIKKEYGGISKFFQNLIRAYDGKGALESRIKMKEIQIQEYKNKIKELKAEKESLEEKLENGDFDELNTALESDPRDHPEWEKASRIVGRKYREGDIRGPDSRDPALQHWANTIGISKERLFELVVDSKGESVEEVNA